MITMMGATIIPILVELLESEVADDGAGVKMADDGAGVKMEDEVLSGKCTSLEEDPDVGMVVAGSETSVETAIMGLNDPTKNINHCICFRLYFTCYYI